MDNQFNYGGVSYSFGVIPPFEAVKVELVVVKAIGEPLFRAFSESKKQGVETNILDTLANHTEETPADAESLGKAVASTGAAIGMITSRLHYTEIEELLTTVFKYVSANGKRVIIEQDFLGKNRALWVVLFAALRFNFTDFLTDGLSTLVKGKAL